VSAGQTLTVTLAGGSGDADLHVRAGAKPTVNAFDCRPRLRGNSETCSIVATADGIYWIGARTRSAYAGVSLQATLSNE
jgi:serine protease